MRGSRWATTAALCVLAWAPLAVRAQPRPADAPATSAPAASAPAASGPAARPEVKPGEAGGTGGGIESIEKPKQALFPELKTEGRLRRPERAVIGLEVGGALQIPFRNYLQFGSGANQYYMENGLGGGFSLSLTLNDVEVGWTYSVLGTGRVSGRIPDEVRTWLEQISRQTGGTGVVPAQIDLEAGDALKFHALTFGYRLTFEPARVFHLVVPFGIGIVAAQPPSFGLLNYSLWGFASYAGLRGEVLVAKILALALDTRFSIYLTEPDANLGAMGYAATRNAFDAAVAWLPMLSVALHARVYY